MFEKYDTNKDGKLDRNERKPALEARKAEMFKMFDKDGDGKISKEERRQTGKINRISE